MSLWPYTWGSVLVRLFTHHEEICTALHAQSHPDPFTYIRAHQRGQNPHGQQPAAGLANCTSCIAENASSRWVPVVAQLLWHAHANRVAAEPPPPASANQLDHCEPLGCETGGTPPKLPRRHSVLPLSKKKKRMTNFTWRLKMHVDGAMHHTRAQKAVPRRHYWLTIESTQQRGYSRFC